MSNHLLLEKANAYKLPGKTISLKGCSYNSVNGYWEFADNHTPVVTDSDFVKPRSKKCDRETGEDQKGE